MQPAKINMPYQRPRRTPLFANALHTLPYKQQQLKYMHQTFFSPPHQTIIDAANNKQLTTIPLLGKPDQVRKHLAPSPATSKGRLKKQRANVRSTRKKPRSSKELMQE